MQAQQTLAFPRRSFSMAVAVVATFVAAALAVALVAAVHPAAAPRAASSVVVLHEQAPDAAERNQSLAAQRASNNDQNQTPDAKERNQALSQGK